MAISDELRKRTHQQLNALFERCETMTDIAALHGYVIGCADQLSTIHIERVVDERRAERGPLLDARMREQHSSAPQVKAECSSCGRIHSTICCHARDCACVQCMDWAAAALESDARPPAKPALEPDETNGASPRTAV